MMVYQQTAAPEVLWPEPMELIWQVIGLEQDLVVRWKRPDIGLSDRLFIGAVVNLPGEQRPWGSITWLAEMYVTSRETIYDIGRQVRQALLGVDEAQTAPVIELLPDPNPMAAGPLIRVTDNRLKRTILSLLLPAGASLRAMQDCLDVALDKSRSVGYLSEFITEAGERAGKILADIDYSPLGKVIVARDETYFNGLAFLVAVEPHSYVLLAGQVEQQCDSEIWGLSLALDQSREGLQIVGLSEDAASFYEASLKKAAELLPTDFSVQTQKDVWHVQYKGTAVLRTLTRQAWSQFERAEKLAKAPGPQDEERVEAWLAAELKTDALLGLADQFQLWYGSVCDSLELVDPRSGEIRDQPTNQWLLDETLQALSTFDHPKIKEWLTYIKNQSDQLFTFLDWLEVALDGWCLQADTSLTPTDVTFFERLVARAWRLQRAVVNGHRSFHKPAQQALALLEAIIADDPTLLALAQSLMTILERVIRTSCAAETVNSVIKPYLRVKRSFRNRQTAQNWFNLFRLWFCMHPFKRSHKRQDKSPFRLAGIKVFTPEGEE
ncbi:MAG: hypothetical protein GY934_06975, partial [Gammaproteobacteria bacterium]|nr:hypothetical protein [Gammaproteobacteria bacterium]